MEQKQRSYKKVNDALRQSLDKLWDDCFGDLPLMQQRVLKNLSMRQSKDAYKHHQRRKIEMKDWEGVIANADDKHFFPTSEQVKVAQQTVDNIVRKFMCGKSRAARYLRYFLKDKKIRVSVCKDLCCDASFDAYNPLTKEIYVDLCAGYFYHSGDYPNLVNEDYLAGVLGHEIGHAVEKLNRSPESEPDTVSSNCWEIDSFCDAFGIRLAADAGYSLIPSMEMIKKSMAENKAPIQPNPHPPLKNRLQFIESAEMIFQTKDRKITPFDERVTSVEWDAKVVEVQLWNALKKLTKRGSHV